MVDFPDHMGQHNLHQHYNMYKLSWWENRENERICSAFHRQNHTKNESPQHKCSRV